MSAKAIFSSEKYFAVNNETGGDFTEILIYDQIGKDWLGEGTGAKEFVEALNAIPKSRVVKLRLNCPGGNVYDGLAITNACIARGNVDTQVDGVAASIAATIFLGGKNRVMCAGTSLMTHGASMGMEGTKHDFKGAIARLENAEQNIAKLYQERAGLSEADALKLLEGENWMNTAEAVKNGFCTRVLSSGAISNSFDFSKFRHVPENIRNLQITAANRGGQNHTPTTMEKAKIIALLRKHGANVDENATLETLENQLETLMAARAPKAADASAPDATVINRLKAFEDKYADMENRYATQRNKLVTDRVDLFIAERRVTAQDRQHWIDAALKDEKTLDVLARMPQVLPPEGISASIENIGESPEDVCKGVINLSKPMRSFERGNEIEPKDMSAHAVNRTALILKNLTKLRHQVQNAHAIDSDLKRSVIMTEGMDAFKRRVLLTSIFSTTYNKVPLLGTDKVEVPYYPIFSTTSRTFVDGTGYEFDESSDTQAKEVTIDKRVYQSFKYTSSFLNRQPYFDVSRLFLKQVNQLAIDVIGKAGVGVLSQITLANFGAAVKNLIPSAFIPETIAELATLAEQADWPGVARSLAIDSTFNENIVKSLMKANEAGSDDALRRGMTGQIAGFDIYSNPRIPSNSEGLVGFMCMPSALLVATSPIMPGPGVQKQLVKYDVITDPDSGLSFEYRFWGDADLDIEKEVVECNFGHAVGEVAALERITNI